jgi:hypothetical protein
MKKRSILLLFTLALGSMILYPAIEVSSFSDENNKSSIDQGASLILHAVHEYYLSPHGDDISGKGTANSPWHSLNRAWQEVKPGDIIYMKGGTYLYKTRQSLHHKDGKIGNHITVMALKGEHPVLSPHPDFNDTRGIDIQGDYLHFKGLEITGFIQKSAKALYYGIVAENSSHNIFEQLKVHDNGFGLSIGSNSGDNLILNSDFYRNADPLTSFGRNKPWGGADGITIRTSDSSRTNTIRGCRMWWNSDDGVDLFENQGTIVIEHCWSFWNGYQPGTFEPAGDGDGYKLGITATDQSDHERRLLRFNLSFENRARGFDQNNAKCITLLYNNTSYNNANRGKAARSFDFWNGNAATMAKNNIDFHPSMSAIFNDEAIVTYNTFQKDGSDNTSYSVTRDDFLSIDSKGVDGPRHKDGSLPDLKFLKLKKGSDLIDTGTDIGLPYKGKAPDLGAFESDY